MSLQPAVYSPRHVVILAHPDPNGFDGLVADTYCAAVRACGQEAIVRDLYAMGFDPLLKAAERPGKTGFALGEDVVSELAAIRGSDAFVTIYPIWFGMPPAALVGYVQRVLGAGVTAQQVQNGGADTVMRGKRLISISTSGASKIWLEEQHQTQSLRTLMGDYLLRAFGLAEYEELHIGETVDGIEQLFVDQLLDDVDRRARKVCAAIAADRANQPAGLARPPHADGSADIV